MEPLQTTLIVEKPGAQIKGLYIKNAENEPQNVLILGKLLRNFGLNVLAYLISNPSSERASIFLYVEVPVEGTDFSEVEEKVKSVMKVKEVKVIDYPVKSFAYQPFFPLTVFNRRGVFFSAHILGSMFKGIREKLGDSAAKAIMYYAGLSGGKRRAEDVKGERKDLSFKEVVVRLLLSGRALGQYIGELVEFNEDRRTAVIRVVDSWESQYAGRGYDEPQCEFMRGFFEGFLEGLLSAELESEETLCQCKGDPYCEFRLKPAQ